jgi:hypothetical protein
MRTLSIRLLPVALLLLPLAPATAGAAAESPPSTRAPAAEDALSPQSALSGRDIYQCVLDNRFRSYVQTSALLSGDRGGSTQESRLRMTWQSFRDEEDQPTEGVFSKTVVRYSDPFDLRNSGYLIINNEARPNDQFVYLSKTRRIRRVNLRREAVFGTDFTFEDIVPREIEDGDYRRMPDAIVDGVSTYVVEVVPREHAESDYSKFVIHVDKTNCVPLLTRYWDRREIEVKELTAPAAQVRELDGVWWPMELTMRNLQLDTFTTLRVEDMEPNPELPRKIFDLRRLEQR